MIQRIVVPRATLLVSLTAIALVGTKAAGDDKAKPPLEYQGKALIENPTKAVISKGSAPLPGPFLKVKDIRKGVIEKPTEDILALKTGASGIGKSTFDNPKVEPGRVHWHDSFPSACSASSNSGKPVLLFQMMGRLDEQFC